MNIVSYGGGTNSTAMIIGLRDAGIPIDLIAFSDTGGERQETYEYIKTFSMAVKAQAAAQATGKGRQPTSERNIEK